MKMYSELAVGLSNRFNYIPIDELDNYYRIAHDVFVSLWHYDDYILKYYKITKTNAGFDGKLYFPDNFILDIDGKTPTDAQNKTIGLITQLNDMGISTQPFFSGTGFHVEIPSMIFEWEPCPDLNMRVKKVLENAGVFELADISVIDNVRLIRLVNTLNSKSKKYKIPITYTELTSDIEEILELAKTPRIDFNYPVLESDPVFDIMEQVKPEKLAFHTTKQIGHDPDPTYYTCIQTMLTNLTPGSRHQIALRLAAWFRWRYPRDVVHVIMENWRKKASSSNHPFLEKEMNNIIETSYTGHNGDGNRYGCDDAFMSRFCSKKCRLYDSKKATIIINSSNMKNLLINRLRNPVEGINVGALYGKDWVVEPGEFVLLKAEPKSMKTYWLQNIIHAFKKPTYFLEMEMSPIQIAKRFACMEYCVEPKEVDQYIDRIDSKMENDFSWLTMDFSKPFVHNLEKIINTLSQKPEIVIIDHIRLLRAKNYDTNEKVDEKTEALIRLAIKYDLIVFGIIEMSKMGMQSKGGFGTAKGSVGSEYNASKILTLTPNRLSNGKIKDLKITTDGDREGGSLEIVLEPSKYGHLTTAYERFK